MSLANAFNAAAQNASPPLGRQALGRELLELVSRPANGDSQNLNITARAEALIRSGADLEVTNEQGRTPLLCAVKVGRLRIIDAIIEGGANLRHRDKDGLGAVDLARNNKRILQLLHAADERQRTELRQELSDMSSRRDFTPLRPMNVKKRLRPPPAAREN